MPRYRPSCVVLALGTTALLLIPLATLSPPAAAHETQVVERLRLRIGWGDEPAFTGVKNFVSVDLSGATGEPVTDLGGGSLTVEVSFGDQRIALPLQPAGERRGQFRAWLVPTRPGTYTFHVTGKVKDQTIDATSTCSDQTFDCVTDRSEVEFPVKDPSAGQLTERVSRALPRAERATETASRAQGIALGALALALTSLIGSSLRRGRKGA